MEIAKAVVYLQNRSPICEGTITEFQNLKSDISYLGDLCTSGCRVWVNIPIEKCKKQDDRSYQDIHFGNEGTNRVSVVKIHRPPAAP